MPMPSGAASSPLSAASLLSWRGSSSPGGPRRAAAGPLELDDGSLVVSAPVVDDLRVGVGPAPRV